MEEKRYTFDDLLDIMKQLRSDDGCPWDREQTYESLKKYVIEETYEVIEAVDLQDRRKLCEELGDLLLQVVFYAQIAKEKNEFGMADVIDGICRKLIHRHPHVFGDVVAETPDQVMENWEVILQEFRLGRKRYFFPDGTSEGCACQSSCVNEELQAAGKSCTGWFRLD